MAFRGNETYFHLSRRKVVGSPDQWREVEKALTAAVQELDSTLS